MTVATATPTFTSHERKVLPALRTRYRGDRDLFSDKELNRLRFLLWLHRTGRLPS